jgi:hypothetical protein
MKQGMDKQEHLQYLKEKYIELSRQFLSELQNGKSIHMLKDLSAVINTLLKEIDVLEKPEDEKKKVPKT